MRYSGLSIFYSKNSPYQFKEKHPFAASRFSDVPPARLPPR
jgi:hypothetical protein